MKGIVFSGKKRFYKEDLTERDYLLENTTPVSFSLYDYIIEETSWGEMLRSVVALLLSIFPEKRNGLLSFKCFGLNS